MSANLTIGHQKQHNGNVHEIAGTPTAAISWEEAIAALQAGNLPCSGSEASILRLAASLASTSPVALRDAITGLDQANIHLVLNAIRHASGRN